MKGALRRKSVGFSLVELLVYMAVLTSVTSILYVFFHRSSRLVCQGNRFLYAQHDMESALACILRDIRSTHCVLPVQGDARSGEKTLILAIPSVDDAGKVVGEHFDTVIYSCDSGSENSILRSTFPDPVSRRTQGTHRLGLALAGVSFGYNAENPADASRVTVKVITRGALLGRKSDVILGGSAFLRNTTNAYSKTPGSTDPGPV